MLLCVSIPDYPLAVVRRSCGDDNSGGVSPLIVADRPDRGHVLAVDERASDAGARAGQTVTQAVATAARARVAVYDASHGHAVWEEVLDALDAVSPLVDDVRPGLAFLDMRGIAGTTVEWMAQTRETLSLFQLPVRLGIGANQIAARAAAYVADGTVCEQDRERATLAPLPLTLLDLDSDTIERLRLLGIDRLGDLARLPHGPFVRRFGARATRWHALSRGIDATPFVPRGHAVAIEAAMYGEGRADDEAQVIFALRMLLARIASDLERCGRRAGALQLDVELEDAQTQHFDVPLALPTAQERAMLDVVRAKLEGVTFPAAIVGLRVRAAALEEGGEAVALFAAGDDLDPQAIAVTIARLEGMLGESVRQAGTRSAHVLEERFAYDRFEPPKRATFGGGGDSDASSAAAATLSQEIVPQLRLLAVTEIDVRVRGGEPAFVGTPPHAVIECAGPWRIAMEGLPGGGAQTAIARDEYDVLLEDGELYRIYRQGRHWYLRGTYD
jgi:nucleotidyltransferase/DNA polymerase involved in DNA repair